MTRQRDFIMTPEVMRARRLLEKSLRGKTGEAVSSGHLDVAWKRLQRRERNLLRLSHTFNIVSSPVIQDLKNPYLNLAFMALLLIPGPGVSFVTVPLALSYLVRTDERAKEARRNIKQMIKNDIPVEQYRHFIKYHKHAENNYRLDGHSLLHHKISLLKNGAAELRKAAAGHSPDLYNKWIGTPFRKTGRFFYRAVSKVTGEQRASSVFSPLFNKMAKMEQGASVKLKSAVHKMDGFLHKTGVCLKEAFCDASEVKDQCAEALYYGWEFNKREIRMLLRSRCFPRGSKPF